MDHTPTPSQTAGPFFHLGLTTARSVHEIADVAAKGEHMRIICRVLDGEGTPLNDAMIEIWQADAEGKYNHSDDPRGKTSDPHCTGFGRLGTDQNGTCIFETIKPGRVPTDQGGFQAPHLNISVFARGILQRLATRMYFSEDPCNAEDPVLALVPQDRKGTLMAHPDPADPQAWRFDIRLCGDGETVFFDI